MSPSIWSESFRRMFCWKGTDRRMPILQIPTARIRKVRPLPLQKRSPERRYVRHQNFRKSRTLDGISRDFTDLTVNPSSPAAIQLDTATSRLYQRVYLIFALTADSDGTLTVSQNSDMVYQIPFTAGEKKKRADCHFHLVRLGKLFL